MTITVIDSYAAMREILHAPHADRPTLLRRMLEPVAGMYRFFPGEPDLVDLHHMGSAFRIDRDDERVLPALEAMHEARVWQRIETALNDALKVQLDATPGITVPDIQVLLVLGDPADTLFMDTALGVTGNGGLPGYVLLNVWPFPENLERIEATAVHELNHNLRYSTVVWNPMTVTVGEHGVSEGLADAFARQLYGERGYTRIGVPPQGDDEAFEKVLAGLDVTGMQNFASYVHGDTIAARYGGTPVGLPTGAGYAAGNRLVDAYLAATGRTAAEALLVDAAEIIAVTR